MVVFVARLESFFKKHFSPCQPHFLVSHLSFLSVWLLILIIHQFLHPQRSCLSCSPLHPHHAFFLSLSCQARALLCATGGVNLTLLAIALLYHHFAFVCFVVGAELRLYLTSSMMLDAPPWPLDMPLICLAGVRYYFSLACQKWKILIKMDIAFDIYLFFFR